MADPAFGLSLGESELDQCAIWVFRLGAPQAHTSVDAGYLQDLAA
jgi:hypothetical protein